MKRLSYVLIFLFTSVGVALWAAQNYAIRWEPQLKSALENRVSKTLHLRLELGGVRLAYFYRIDVTDVRLWKSGPPEELVFRAPRLSLKISWLDLPRAIYHRNLTDALGVIHLQDAWISASPSLIDSLPHFKKAKSSPSMLEGPLFFSVTWENGTVRWTDVARSSVPVEMTQINGVFKIRGPKIDFALKAKPQTAEALRLDYGKLGRRWSSRIVLKNANVQETLRLMKAWVPSMSAMNPEDWTGKVTLDAEGGARQPYQAGMSLHSILKEATLTFDHFQRRSREKQVALLNGEAHYEDGRLEPDDLTLTIGSEAMKVTGSVLPFETPAQVDLTASGTNVTATVQAHYQDGLWHFGDKNVLNWANGHVRWLGTVGEKASDLRVTVQDLWVERAAHLAGIPNVSGRFNASSSWKGPLGRLSGLGSFWIKGISIDGAPPSDLQGDFDITPDQFRAQAGSGDPRFRFFLQGFTRAQDFRIESLEVRLPSGGVWSGHFTKRGEAQNINGVLRGDTLQLPNDIPYLRRWASNINTQGALRLQIDGTWDRPTLKGDLKMANATSISWIWQNRKLHLETPWLHADLAGEFPENAFVIQGRVLSPKGREQWEMPLEIRGIPSKASKPGSLQLKAETIWLQGRKTAPFEAHVEWNDKEVRWKDAHWGKPWSSEGTLTKDAQGKSTLQGVLRATRLPLEEWSSFKGTISGDLNVSGSLEEPRVALNASVFGGRVRFTGGYQKEKQSLYGSLALEKIGLKSLGETLRLTKPLDGPIQGALTVSGPLSGLRFTGHLDGGPVTYGDPTQRPIRLHDFSMDMTAARQPDHPEIWRLTLTEAQIRTEEETVRFQNGSYLEYAGTGPSRMNMGMEIRNLQIGLARLFGGLVLDGTWESKAAGLSIQGNVHTRSLFINDYELQEGQIHADYYDRILTFTPPARGAALMSGTIDFRQIPQLHFTQFRIAGKEGQGLGVDGDVGPSKWDFHMAGQKIDLGVLAGLAGFPYPLTGVADVAIQGTGDLQHPHAEGTLDVKAGRVVGLSFDTGSTQFIWSEDRLSFQKLQLSASGRYTLIGSGSFPVVSKSGVLPSDPKIDFTVRLENSNLSLMRSIMPEVRDARGEVEAIVQVTGTPDQPQLRGQLKVRNGSITNAHYFRKLSNIQVNADFIGQELILHELRGTSGEGEIQANGKIAFAGLTPSSYDLHAIIPSRKGVEIQVPELAIPESPLAKKLRFLTSNSYGVVRGSMTFQGSAEAPTFRAQALITNGHFTFPPSRRGESNPAVLAWFNRVHWDVDLRFQDEAWFENDYVAAKVLGGFHLKGPNDHMRSDGSLDVTEGRVNYLGLQFDIRTAHLDLRSDVDERGTVANVAYLRGTADSRVQQNVDNQSTLADPDDTITLTVDYAPLSAIKPRLTSLSNPNLSQEKLLVRAGNLDVEKLTPQERTQLYQQQMVRVIDSSLTTPLARKILRPIGLNIRSERVIDPGVSQLPTTPGAEVAPTTQEQNSGLMVLANSKYTIETTLAGRLSLGYGVRFMPTTTPDLQNRLDLVNDLQLSYRVFKTLYVRGSYELPNANNPNYTPDRKTIIEQQWRFPWTLYHKKNPPKPADTNPPAESSQ